MMLPMDASDRGDAARVVAPDVVLDTPCVVVDEDVATANLVAMQELARAHGVALRPHVKTHKTRELAARQLAVGACGITCAKLGEAEAMVSAGIRDVFVAYPTVGPLKAPRLLALLERARVVVGVDGVEGARRLGEAVAAAGHALEVSLEVDTGHHRSGVAAGEAAARLGGEIARLPGIRLTGVFTHEGHAGDAAEPDAVRDAARAAGAALVETAERLRGDGVPIATVSVGSTPAAPHTASVAGVTEMRPGTYVFNDTAGFRLGIPPARCAARVLATVVSRPGPEAAILDAGSKALSLETGRTHPGHGYVVGHPDVVVHRLSEEHGWVRLPAGEPGFEVGDRVEIVPNHVCPVVNLTDELVVVRDGRVTAIWPVAARGRVR